MSNQTILAAGAIALLTEALNSEHGITVKTEDPSGTVMAPVFRAKQVLYRFKKENPEFACLTIRVSPDNPETELWITKGWNISDEGESSDESYGEIVDIG